MYDIRPRTAGGVVQRRSGPGPGGSSPPGLTFAFNIVGGGGFSSRPTSSAGRAAGLEQYAIVSGSSRPGTSAGGNGNRNGNGSGLALAPLRIDGSGIPAVGHGGGGGRGEEDGDGGEDADGDADGDDQRYGGGYRYASSDGYGNGAGDGGVNGYGGGGMEMIWHPTSSLPIKVESPPP